MAPSPEKTAAIAALLRAVLAMLAEHPLCAPLIDWGDTLHERFSLPFFLERDLRERERGERCVVELLKQVVPRCPPPPPAALEGCVVDLRWQ